MRTRKDGTENRSAKTYSTRPLRTLEKWTDLCAVKYQNLRWPIRRCICLRRSKVLLILPTNWLPQEKLTAMPLNVYTLHSRTLWCLMLRSAIQLMQIYSRTNTLTVFSRCISRSRTWSARPQASQQGGKYHLSRHLPHSFHVLMTR